MNNQFSQRVSDIIVYSKEEANRLRSRYIGPEHLLLGMLRDGEGKAIEILSKLNTNLAAIKQQIEAQLKAETDDMLLPDTEVPLSNDAAKILKMCILEARGMKSNIADTEHVLLAILREKNNMAASVLESNNVNYVKVLEQATLQPDINSGMGFTEDDDDEEDDSDDDGTYELDAIHKFATNAKEEDDVTTIDGAAAIKGATGLTYKVTKEDIGYRLICQVKAKKYSGYLAGQTTTYVPKLIPEIPKVTLGSFVYSNKKKLSSIRLPERFSWVDSTIVPVYGNSGYRAKYVPENATMYRTVIIRVKVPVKKKALTKKMIRLKKKYAYEGKAIKGNETVKDGKEVLDSGKDYKASYQNNKNLGKATITIKGIGNYKGTKKVSYTIVKRSIRSVTCHYKKTKSYTGRWVKPNVTLKVGKVKLEKNRDYTLVYRNNLQIGKASVVIQGMGNFTGKKTISFKIVPQTPKIQKLKKNKKSFAITYSSGKMVHGYQMEVSTASSFATKKTQKYILNGNRFEACGLKKGTYYIRVKAYYSKKENAMRVVTQANGK